MRFTTLVSALIVALGVDAVAIPEPDGTLSARQSQTSTDPLWTDHVKFRDALLKRHNDFRGAHAVGKLTWNTTLSGFAGKYLQKRGTGKNTCPNFEHSGGPYGENLAIGYGTPTQAVSAWGDERADYNWKKPDFSPATGHFTQMVWKDTRQVGCARKYCTSSNVYRGWYLACEYWPRGNVIGQFGKQVFKGRYKQKRDGEDLSTRDDEFDDEFDDEADFLEDFDGEAYVGEPLAFFDN